MIDIPQRFHLSLDLKTDSCVPVVEDGESAVIVSNEESV